ncbi:MAG: hypothetical protein ACXVEF_02345 [Polyangiales bacterium]
MIRFLRAAFTASLFSLLALSGTRCAESRCQFTSDCDRGLCLDGTCTPECNADIDCPTGRTCFSGICRVGDAGVDTGTDSTPPTDSTPVDSSTPSDTGSVIPGDSSSPPPDTTVTPDGTTGGTKAYLTTCGADSECVSGLCAAGSPRFCTQTCTANGDCADGQICSAGKCALDDIGSSGCDLASGSPCKQACFGSSTVASARHCTHTCSTGTDCPAGYACSEVAAGKPKVCVDIERPCATADQCPSGLGFCGAGGLGCTAKCNDASDCPARLVGLSPYTCEVKSGAIKVCVPPSDVLGPDSLGSSCSSTGTNTCRSGACDDGVSPPMCNQRCTVGGGCGKGWGCFPLEDPGPPKSTLLVCTAATGSGWLGDVCTKARDCLTGICQSPGYCTRLCVDGLCPTGMSCVAAPLTATDGTPIKLCTK